MTALASATSLEEALSRAQFRRRIVVATATSIAAFFLLFVESSWQRSAPHTHDFIRSLGLLLILLGIAGRTWSVTYIGGRKKIDLVQEGPYSVVRHPLYVFSVTAAAGIGALWGSIIVAALLAVTTGLILRPIARQEEEFLTSRFGADYTEYARRVGRFFPRSFNWKSRTGTINRDVVLRTFVQSCLFLTAIPLAAAIAYGHEAGILPILASLP